jgi:O-succinylbenzoate synthase
MAAGAFFQLQYRRYRLPFRGPVRTAHGVWPEREGVILRWEDEDGSVGFGEAAPIPEFGTESIDEVETAFRDLGETPNAVILDAVPSRLVCTRHALAAARGRSAPNVAHKYLSVAALLPAGRAALKQIATKTESGFRIFKWKVGVVDIADELALLDDVCAALPTGGKLRLDANGAWDRRKAERWLERCAERPIDYIEQPCLAATTDAPNARAKIDDVLLGLANEYPTPLALDESLVGDDDIEKWLGAGWPGVFVVKPLLLPDVAESVALLARAKASVVFSSALETAVGARDALRIAFAWPGEARAVGFGVWPLFADRRFDGPVTAPFIRAEDVERMDPEAIWNLLG